MVETAVQSGSLFRNNGRRLTPQRAMLLELIRTTPGHLDAEGLYALARERRCRISLSTVYRTIAVLKALGYIEELHLGEGHHHYEAKEASAHCHFVCANCGVVIEYHSGILSQLSDAMEQLLGCSVKTLRVEGSGLCSSCRGASGEEKEQSL